MPATAQERLARIRNRQTLYELTIAHPDGRRYLVAYAQSKGRTDLWRSVTSEKRVDRIVKLTGTEEITFAKRAADGATMGDWAIRFTGRTQRDCIVEGELTYIGSL